MNYRMIATATDDPEVIELARAADEATRNHRVLKARADARLRQLDDARAADARAAADAIEAGRKIPAPTETKIREELDDLGRDLAAAAEVARRAEHRYRSAIIGAVGDRLVAEAQARTVELSTTIRQTLATLTEQVADLDDAERIARYVHLARRYHDEQGGDVWPGLDAAALLVPVVGGHTMPVQSIADRISAALPIPDPTAPTSVEPVREPTELELLESGHMYGR
jgi:hypothetical protein